MPLTKPQNSLNTSDIEGSQPQCVKFKSIRQGIDPLNPRYRLSEVDVKPPTPTKFKRDPLQIDDIEGTRSRRTWKGGEVPRGVNQLDDILGTRST